MAKSLQNQKEILKSLGDAGKCRESIFRYKENDIQWHWKASSYFRVGNPTQKKFLIQLIHTHSFAS